MTGWAAHAVLLTDDPEMVVCAAARERSSGTERREKYIMTAVADIPC